MSSMFDKLEEVERRYREVDTLLSDSDIFKDRKNFQKLSRERAKIAPVVESYQRYKKVLEHLDDNKLLLHEQDEEIKPDFTHNATRRH